MLVTMHPVLIRIRFYLFKLEPRVWVKCKPVPIVSWNDEVADEQAFSGSGQIENADCIIDLAGAHRADGT